MRNYYTSGTVVIAKDIIDKGRDLMVKVTGMTGSLFNGRDRRIEE